MSSVIQKPDFKRIEQLREKLDSTLASPAAWCELEPLPEPVSEAPGAYPLEGLGPLLGDAARSIATNVQAPDALAAGSVLAAASLAVQAHADIELPHGSRAPMSVFVLTAAQSGDRKTATDNVACFPVVEHRKEQARDYAKAMREHQSAVAARMKGEPEERAPVAQSLVIGKATTEGLHNILRGQPHIGVFTGEGGELLGGHSLREERRVAGVSWYLKAWGGETLDDLTRGGGLSLLPGRRVCLHAMVQPVLMRQLLADPLASGQGLLARCLIAEPETLAGTRLYSGSNPYEAEPVKMYHAALRELLKLAPRVYERGDGFELNPRPIKFSPKAQALWVEFYNEVEAQQANGGELANARAFASKAAEHAARIAGVIEVASNQNAELLTEQTMEGAIVVAAFYMGEHLRLTGAGMEHRRLNLLHSLVDWLREQPSPVKASSLLQRSRRQVRVLKAEGIKRLTDELAQRGYIRAVGTDWEVRP